MFYDAVVSETALLVAARAGDDDAFRELVTPYVGALNLHCYRLLGSYHEAEEVMQEVLVRAWRYLDGYRGEAPLRHWLYRIATTTALKAVHARAKRPQTVADLAYLEPYPDRLLDAVPRDGDPAAVAERRESVSLAFIVALQLLPATQRAVLVLREVLAWRSSEVAELLETTVPAVNSALQRARATLRTGPAAGGRRRLDADDHRVLAGFVDAWHRRDIPALAALLREDVALRMPPVAMEFLGRDAVVRFFATVPAGGALETMRLVPTRANGQPAAVAFTRGEDRWQPYGVMVFDVDGGLVAAVTGFPMTADTAFGRAFGVRPGNGGPATDEFAAPRGSI